MGNPKQKWTAEEEEALRAGVAKHGAGKWKNIQRDPEFNHLLFSRSNIDLKDKWRNLSVASGQGPRDKSKTPKAKANAADGSVTPVPVAQNFTSVTSSTQDASSDAVMIDASKPLPDGNNAAKYNAMIYEALATLKDPNGLDSSAIANFIEQSREVTTKFRRSLSSRLRRLVQQNKLEKIGDRYNVKKEEVLEARAPVARQKEISRPSSRPVPYIGHIGDTMEEAAMHAAFRVAEAENKSFVAAESVKESERVSMMAEDMESLLQFATYCFDQSGRGEILLLA